MVRPSKEWFTVKEVSELVGEPTQTVYRWIRLKRLAAIDEAPQGALKPTWRIHKSSLDRLLDRISRGLPVGA